MENTHGGPEYTAVHFGDLGKSHGCLSLGFSHLSSTDLPQPDIWGYCGNKMAYLMTPMPGRIQGF